MSSAACCGHPAGTDTASGKNAWLTPGGSFTWKVTLANTRYWLGDFSVLIEETLESGHTPMGCGAPTRRVEYDTEAVEYSFSIVTPVRALEPHWNDYCDLNKALIAQGALLREMKDCVQSRADPASDSTGCPFEGSTDEWLDYWDVYEEALAVGTQLERGA